jgi:ferredoxin-NADP reductase/predicted pyridoxine 5'-phosphate oxidase superfamily flavin-nucleotide-binding protein
MAHKFAEIAFTPTVRAIQKVAGSRLAYSGMDEGEAYNHRLGQREADFISKRDSFYLATVSETSWPYLQHRGGPAGFVKILDEGTLGFADYSGNRQYVSTGNLRSNNRVALFFMDYPNRRRLKLLGRVREIGADEPELLAQLERAEYPAQVERGFIIAVHGFDWNCPQHISPRFTLAELEQGQQVRAAMPPQSVAESPFANAPAELGSGPLALVVSGIRQLTPRVRAFELKDPEGGELPAVAPGAHLRVPVRLSSGEVVDRHYSIASNPVRRDVYEIAVLREEQGSGGSAAVHDGYQLGIRLRIDHPVNHFALHSDERPAVLIAGGIGITAIKPMAQALQSRGSEFVVHYAGRSRNEMAFQDRLRRQFGKQLRLYSSADAQRLDLASILADAPSDAVIYVCGPARLISAVRLTATDLGYARAQVQVELFQ